MQSKKRLKVKPDLLLRLEIKRFGRVDRYYIDANESNVDFLHGVKEPHKATTFSSLADIRRIIDANTSRICSFEILHILDQQQIATS